VGSSRDVAVTDVAVVPSRRADPQSPQNFLPGSFAAPQLGHTTASGAPQSPQNFFPAWF
jgi:hypothetical protein